MLLALKSSSWLLKTMMLLMIDVKIDVMMIEMKVGSQLMMT